MTGQKGDPQTSTTTPRAWAEHQLEWILPLLGINLMHNPQLEHDLQQELAYLDQFISRARPDTPPDPPTLRHWLQQMIDWLLARPDVSYC